MIVTKEETLSLQAIFVKRTDILQMIVTKEETLSLQAIFVKRTDILNDNRIETGYHWKK